MVEFRYPVQVTDPLLKREQFAISLRKEKKKAIICERRKGKTPNFYYSDFKSAVCYNGYPRFY